MDVDFLTCPECGRPYPSTHVLDWHRKTVHGISTLSESTSRPASGTLASDEASVSVQCPECGQTFQYSTSLEWHLENAHGIRSPDSSQPPADLEQGFNLERRAAADQRTFNRRAGCIMYAILLLVFVIGGVGFHWDTAFVVVGIVGTIVVYFITRAMDEREDDWKEATREEFRRNFETPPRYTQTAVPRVLTHISTEQEACADDFAEKWRQIGLLTSGADRSEVEEAFASIYETIGLSPPQIVWCDSPLAAALTMSIVQRSRAGATPSNAEAVWELARERVTAEISDEFWRSVRQSVQATTVIRMGRPLASRIRGEAGWRMNRYEDNTWDRADYLIQGAVGDQIRESIGRRIIAGPVAVVEGVRQTVIASLAFHSVLVTRSEAKQDQKRADADDFAYTGEIDVRDVSSPDMTRYEREKLKVRVRNTLGDRAEDSIGNSVTAGVRNSCYGQHDAAFLALFDYFRIVCGLVTQTDSLIGQWEQAQSGGWYLPYENICWVSERPCVLRLNSRDRLHCDIGPALEYPDGWRVYALNGVVMKPDYVLTPSSSLEPDVVLREPNAEIRRELLRKIGVSRMVGYGRVIDRRGNYQLIDMSPVFRGSGIGYAPYLLMPSASIDGVQHLEGVSPDCRTVEQAINWRASQVTAEPWDPDSLS